VGHGKDRTARTIGVYDANAETFLAHWGRRRYRVPPLLAALLRSLPPGSRVLDLGCGPGLDLRHVASRDFRGVGLDRSLRFLSHAKKKNPDLLLVAGDIRRPPFAGDRFEAVWAAASLIHLSKSDVRKALRELRDLIRPGGRLAATLVHGTASGFRRRGWLPGRYFSRWTKEELRRAVRRAGWTVESLEVAVNRERKGRWINLVARR
jgi:SAM-dependent methyltransferase